MPLLQAKYKTADIVAQIDAALEGGESYVLNRIADGEANFLAFAKGKVLTKYRGGKRSLWDWYRLSIDNDDALEAIIKGLPICDALGIPTLEPWADMFNMTPGLIESFNLWGLNLAAAPLTHHAVVQFMILRGEFERWHDRRMVVVNEDAEAVAEGLKPSMNIVGAITIGRDEIDEVIGRIAKYDFEIALLGVGIRKFAIAHQVAGVMGAVVLDVGYTLNILSHVHPTKIGTNRDTYVKDWHVAEKIVRERGNEV